MSQAQAAQDRTGIAVPPPLVYAAGFLVGWGLDRWKGFSAEGSLPLAGILLLLAAGALLAWSFQTLRQARTTVNPFGGTTAIVDTGPYAQTRNPIYIAMTIGYVGLAFLVGRVGPLLALPLVLLWIDRMVVEREERYLEGKFGAAYARYRDGVRRWL